MLWQLDVARFATLKETSLSRSWNGNRYKVELSEHQFAGTEGGRSRAVRGKIPVLVWSALSTSSSRSSQSSFLFHNTAANKGRAVIPTDDISKFDYMRQCKKNVCNMDVCWNGTRTVRVSTWPILQNWHSCQVLDIGNRVLAILFSMSVEPVGRKWPAASRDRHVFLCAFIYLATSTPTDPSFYQFFFQISRRVVVLPCSCCRTTCLAESSLPVRDAL